jgi:hypothetical protein
MVARTVSDTVSTAMRIVRGQLDMKTTRIGRPVVPDPEGSSRGHVERLALNRDASALDRKRFLPPFPVKPSAEDRAR